jgi:hypothetical protein
MLSEPDPAIRGLMRALFEYADAGGALSVERRDGGMFIGTSEPHLVEAVAAAESQRRPLQHDLEL